MFERQVCNEHSVYIFIKYKNTCLNGCIIHPLIKTAFRRLQFQQKLCEHVKIDQSNHPFSWHPITKEMRSKLTNYHHLPNNIPPQLYLLTMSNNCMEWPGCKHDGGGCSGFMRRSLTMTSLTLCVLFLFHVYNTADAAVDVVVATTHRRCPHQCDRYWGHRTQPLLLPWWPRQYI